jgi:hypothetical protein
MAFALFFVVPLAAYVVQQLVSNGRNTFHGYRIVGWSVCLFVVLSGLWQAHSLFHGWASSSKMVQLLSVEAKRGNDHYLAEDCNVSRYYLRDATNPWQWNSLDYFTYTDKDNLPHAGEDAYVNAINEGYFDLVELSFGSREAIARSIVRALRASNRYDLIAKSRYSNSYGPGYFWLWKKKATPA